MRLPKRLLKRPDPTLDPALIMAALDPGQRARLLDEIEEKREVPGPCGACGAPTTHLRPFAVVEGARLLGARRGECRVLVGYFCPDHDTDAAAGRFRAALLAEAGRRRRAGLDPPPLPNPFREDI